jgi:hypothetical protein
VAAIQNLKGWEDYVLNIHYYNFSLWHEEDKAREKDVPDGAIAAVKRNIDRFNQLRNDSIEKLDDFIMRTSRISTPKSARQNSETPGGMTDRLSILSLRIYHMNIEVKRKNADREHREKCKEKLVLIRRQQKDLARCLNEFMFEYKKGMRYFKTYRQFKMYNDPQLNPALYGKK